MKTTEIAHARRLICSLVTELALMTSALETLEEINRLPTLKAADNEARGEVCTTACDAAFQLSITANEIYPMFSKFASGHEYHTERAQA